MIDSRHDAALGIGSALPAAHAVVGLGKELVSHGLELAPGQVAGCRAVILAQSGQFGDGKT